MIRSILDPRNTFLAEFFERVETYRETEWRATGGARFVEIPDLAARVRIGELPVAVITERARDALKSPPGAKSAATRIVRLSPESALKQVIHHDDLTLDDYRRLPDAIERGEMTTEPSRRHLAFFLEEGSRHYKAVVKQTDYNEIFLTTFQKIHRRDVPRAKRRAARTTPITDSPTTTRSRCAAHGGASRPAEAGNPT